MVRVVVTRPHEIGHSRVDDDVFLAARVLAVQHAREQYARVRDEVTPWLTQQAESRRPDRRDDRLGEGLRRGRLLVVIAHAEAAADVERLQRTDAGGADCGDQLDQLDGAAMVGCDIGDL